MRYWKKRQNIMAFNRFNPPRRDLVEVPNLRGLTLNQATTELDMRGLMVATGRAPGARSSALGAHRPALRGGSDPTGQDGGAFGVHGEDLGRTHMEHGAGKGLNLER
jgi:hypothetical protein